MNFQNIVLNASDTILAWELPEECLADALRMQLWSGDCLSIE